MDIQSGNSELTGLGGRVAVAAESQRDEALVVADAQRGSVAAFEQLYRAHAGRVYGLCLRLTADPGLAEELTQDTFVRAWQKLGSFRRDSAFGTWLSRVATNVVFGHRRAQGRRWARHAEAKERATATHQAAPSGVRMDLEQSIAVLPESARMVFVLYDVEGHSHEEVAERLGVAVGTSKAHLHRARRMLREMLER